MIIISAKISSKKPSTNKKPKPANHAQEPRHTIKQNTPWSHFLQAKLQEPSLRPPGNPSSNGSPSKQSSLAFIRKMVMLASFHSSHSKPWQSAWCMTKQLNTRPPAAQVLTTHLSTPGMRLRRTEIPSTHTVSTIRVGYMVCCSLPVRVNKLS